MLPRPAVRPRGGELARIPPPAATKPGSGYPVSASKLTRLLTVRTSGTGHAGTISVTVRGALRPQNAMKPRFQRVLTRWKPGSTASGTRASSHDHHKLTGNARFRACATPDPGTYG